MLNNLNTSLHFQFISQQALNVGVVYVQFANEKPQTSSISRTYQWLLLIKQVLNLGFESLVLNYTGNNLESSS